MTKSVLCALGHKDDADAAHIAAHVARVLGWRLVVVFTGGGGDALPTQRLGDEVALSLRESRRGSLLLNHLAAKFGCDGDHRYWLDLDASPERLAEIALEQDADVFLLGRSLVRAGYAPAVNAALRESGDRAPLVAGSEVG